MQTLLSHRVAQRLRVSAQVPRCVAGRSFNRVRWKPACVAGGVLCTTGLLVSTRPVYAKESEPRQQVWVWGRRQSIPGGAEKDLLRPQRIEWFESHEVGWKKLAFGPTFGAALDRSGRIFIWGVGESQTADGPEEVFIGPSALDVQGAARGHSFVDVQCSSTHIFALTKRGATFVFEGVADVLKVHTASSATASAAPLKIKGDRMPGLPEPSRLSWIWGGAGIKQMSIGLEHAAFVTSRGELLCTGGNQWGQCGELPPKLKQKALGALEEAPRIETATPVKVKFPANAGRIASVAVGGHHTVAMDVFGQAFAFGDDRRIQLGLGDTRTAGNDKRNNSGVITYEHLGGKTSQAELKRAVTYKYYDQHMQVAPVEMIPPPVQNRPPYPPASQMVCGEDFTIAIHRDSPDWYTSDQETNVLFCCGENGEGQCGRNRQQQQQPWLAVRLPKRTKVVAVACGQGHSIAQLSSGELWGWGMNQQGEVGCGNRASTCPPVRVRLEEEDEPPKKITSLSCGFRNSGCICEVPGVRS